MTDFRRFVAQNKLLAIVLAYLVVVLIALPWTLLSVQKQTQPQSNATAATTLSFSPASAQAAVGASVPVDIMVDPGTNAVSFITLDINYDATKLSAGSTAFTPNPSAFPTIIEGPVYESGRMRIKVSIGADPTKAIVTPTKVGTMTFTALANTNGSATQITYGSSTYILSVAADDNATDNVLASSQPAAITIGSQSTGPTATTAPIATTVPSVTTIPTGFGGPSGVPSLPIATATTAPQVTVVPTPICTPLPPACAAEGSDCTEPANGYCTGEPTATPGPAGPTPTDVPIACQKVKPADIAIVVDISGSMRGDKIKNAKESAKSFLKILAKDANNQVALVTFAKTASVDVSLTHNFVPINKAIDAITLHDWTCTKCAIDAASGDLASRGRPDAKKVIVLLTDGKANTGGSGGNGTTADRTKTAEQAAINAVKNTKVPGLLVYTIGIGKDVNPTFLQELAGLTGGAYYFADTPVKITDQFINVYTSLNNAICSGQPIIPSITLQITPSESGGSDINTVSIIMLTLLLIPVLMLLGHMFL
jgi:Mg-chelatase subunit ChlD